MGMYVSKNVYIYLQNVFSNLPLNLPLMCASSASSIPLQCPDFAVTPQWFSLAISDRPSLCIHKIDNLRLKVPPSAKCSGVMIFN